jgi:hypothetical protein
MAIGGREQSTRAEDGFSLLEKTARKDRLPVGRTEIVVEINEVLHERGGRRQHEYK